jgi:hypothetical protein
MNNQGITRLGETSERRWSHEESVTALKAKAAIYIRVFGLPGGGHQRLEGGRICSPSF